MDQNTNNIPQEGGKGLSIASMVLGIVSIFPGWCIAWAPVILGLIAVILGGISISKKKPGKGMAIAGLVTGIISLALYVVIVLLVGASASFLSSLA